MPSLVKIHRTTCAGCGVASGGTHYKTCRFRGAAEANKKPHPPKLCARCGKAFGESLPPSILLARKHCSRECAFPAVKTRECAVCRARFEHGSKKRSTCSTPCERVLGKRRRDEQVIKVDPKQCEFCGKEFSRIETGASRTSAHTFAKRIVCSLRCAIRLRWSRKQRDEIPPRTCRVCGQEFLKRRKEGTPRFLERTICSRACARETLVKLWNVDGVSMRIDEVIGMLGVSHATALRWLRERGPLKKPMGPKREGRRRPTRSTRPRLYRCGICGQTGHNSQTCEARA